MGKNNIKNCLRMPVLFLIISVLLEVTVFNYRHIFSMYASEQKLDFETVAGNTVYVSDVSIPKGYMYIDVNGYTDEGEAVPVTISISIVDEGNANSYEIEPFTIYPLIEKSKYLSICSYGNINRIVVTMSSGITDSNLYISEMTGNARVPWFISIPRILMMFAALMIVWCVRPGSRIYVYSFKRTQKYAVTAAVLLLNILFFFALVRLNTDFLTPKWVYHLQYYKLAQSIAQGRVSIDAGNDEILSELMSMDNPYDYTSRTELVPGYDQVWDTCYYNGQFYVYFGVVPVLIFYLPWYLLFHSAFPTWFGVFATGALSLCGMFCLIRQICRRWFPRLPFAVYLLISVIASNSINLCNVVFRAEFYYLPVVMALCFTLWGLGFAISAAEFFEKNPGKKSGVNIRLAAAGICLALTAGCRPQFLVASALLIPLLLPVYIDYIKEYKNGKIKTVMQNLTALALPYIVVAAGLMYYNYIRFGSVFDFGAAYNLTTNDMTRRGFNIERLQDGIFMYLFQPVSLKPYFPYVEVTPLYSKYLGSTIRDWTFGGAFCSHLLFISIFAILAVKKELKHKKVYGLAWIAMLLVPVIVAADTELSGIIGRYYTDFQWIIVIPAVIILLQLLEKYWNTDGRKWILWFIVIAGFSGMLFEIGAAVRRSGLLDNNVHAYYYIKSWFEL